MPPCELKTNAPPQLRGAHRYPESVVPGGGQGAPDYGRGARGTHLTRGSFSGTAGSSRHLQGQQQHAVLSQSLSPMESEVPCRSAKTRGFHTQLDEGPETPWATREASGVPFLRQDEA